MCSRVDGARTGTTGRTGRPDGGRRRERGAALVELAIGVLVLVLLLTATIELARAFFAAHVLQNAARTAARELALARIDADATFDEALQSAGVFDARWLVLDLDTLEACGETLDDRFESLPLLHRLLRPLYEVERPVIDGVQRHLLRYPGALVRTDADALPGCGATDLAVVIPSLDADGTLHWWPVVEELLDGDDRSRFRLSEGSREFGLVTLRLHYPFEAITMHGSRVDSGPNFALPELVAPPTGVASPIPIEGARLEPSLDPQADESAEVRDSLGLRRFHRGLESTRAWRRVISADGVFRREVLL